MNRYVEDYQSHHVTITEQMCKDAIAHMRRYPKPDTSVLYYITANSVHIYRDCLPVQRFSGLCADFSSNTDNSGR